LDFPTTPTVHTFHRGLSSIQHQSNIVSECLKLSLCYKKPNVHLSVYADAIHFLSPKTYQENVKNQFHIPHFSSSKTIRYRKAASIQATHKPAAN
jgi:hypothetical protein